jgi:hypothetical protein
MIQTHVSRVNVEWKWKKRHEHMMIQYRLTNLYNFWQWNHGGSCVIRGPGVRLRPKAYSMGNQCPGRLSPSLAGLGIWGGHSRASQRTCPISTACCGCKCNRVVTWFCMSTFQLMSLLCHCVAKDFWERTEAANRYIAAYKKYYGPAALCCWQ